jgi:hypothetical protein
MTDLTLDDPPTVEAIARLSRRRPNTKPRAARKAVPATTSHREPTAARLRIGGDHPAIFGTVIVGFAIIAAACFTISATALVVVGGWQQTPDVIDPLAIIMVDAPILVGQAAVAHFKWKEQTVWLVLARIFVGAMTAFSSYANFVYTVSANRAANDTTGLSNYEEVTGAVFHAAAPVILYVCGEFLVQMITRQKRNITRLYKMTLRDLERVEKELRRRARSISVHEARAQRGTTVKTRREATAEDDEVQA